jgi:exopolysaccharide biosynthesis WecB/TagA/CpsF family protein
MDELLESFHKGALLTVHSDMLMKLQKDREFYELSHRFDYVTCDSQILAFATRFLGTPVPHRISGSDFLPRFYQFHRNNPEVTLFLLGGQGDVAVRARESINTKVGREIVVDALSPPIGAEQDEAACQEMLDRINASRATVLVVGFGAPKQERFLFKYKDQMPHVRMFLPLGGALDYEAGTIQRPPAWISNMGLEWAYRIAQEPTKRWKRYLVDDIPVLFLILKQKLGLYHHPFKFSDEREVSQ